MKFSHRPELHFTADTGLLDSPAGVLYDEKTKNFHLFYHYAPDSDQPSRWGHHIAHTPYTWTSCDDVLTGDCHGGATIHDGEKILLFFTTKNGIESASLPYNPTWGTYTLELDPTVHPDGPIPGLEGHRSPCVFRDPQGGWFMLTVTADHHLSMHHSADAHTWEDLGPMSFAGDVGIPIEDLLLSPRMIYLIDEVDHQGYDVLIATVGRTTGYIVGKCEGTRFHITTPFSPLDYGHDFISPRMTHSPASFGIGTVIFGLMKDPYPVPNEHWSNCLTLPRSLHLEKGKIYQVPVTGLAKNINFSTQARSWTGFIHNLDENSQASIDLIDSQGNIGARIHCTHESLSIDRSINPNHQGDPIALAECLPEQLSIITDGSTVEIFANGGHITMASRIFFEGGSIEKFHASTTGKAHIGHCTTNGPTPF